MFEDFAHQLLQINIANLPKSSPPATEKPTHTINFHEVCKKSDEHAAKRDEHAVSRSLGPAMDADPNI